MKKSYILKLDIIRFLLIIIFLVIWELYGQSGKLNLYYTSMPSVILKDLYNFIVSGDLWLHSSVTLYEAALGLFYGSVVGIIVGIFLAQFKSLGIIFKPIIDAINGIPQLTLAPVYILWFGIGLTSKVFLAGLMVFFGVFFATYNAVLDIDKRLIDAASLLGANRIQTLRHIVIPTCIPWILMGVRSGVGSSLVGAIVGEYMGASAGFGWMIAYATSYFDIKRVMTCILILLFVGLFMNWALNKVENFAVKWRQSTEIILKQNNK